MGKSKQGLIGYLNKFLSKFYPGKKAGKKKDANSDLKTVEAVYPSGVLVKYKDQNIFIDL